MTSVGGAEESRAGEKLAAAPPQIAPRTGRSTLLGGLQLALFALLLSGIVPLALVAEVPDVGRSAAWPITLIIAIWSGVRLSALIADGRPRLFDFFFWMFCYVFMGLAPTVQIRSNLLSTTTPDIDEAFDLPIALLAALGIACYEIGRAIAIALERRRGPEAELKPIGVSRPRVGLLLAFAVLFSAYFVVSVGVGPLLESRESAQAAREARWPDSSVRVVIYALAIYPLTVAIGGMVQIRAVATRHRKLLLAIVLVSAVILLIVVNPLGTARYNFATVFFALAVYAGATATRFRTRITLISALAGLIFLFPIADAFRRGSNGNFERTGFFTEYMGNGDYDAFWQIANAYSYVLNGLVEPGRQLLGSLLFWLPRAVWPDKPTDTGIVLAQFRGYNFENLSAPLWAELLVNGGIPALAIGFVLVGYALRRMDSRLLPAFSQTGLWAIVGAIFPVYMTILLRGSLLQATGYVAVAVASLLFIRARSASKQDDELQPSGIQREEPESPRPSKAAPASSANQRGPWPTERRGRRGRR